MTAGDSSLELDSDDSSSDESIDSSLESESDPDPDSLESESSLDSLESDPDPDSLDSESSLDSLRLSLLSGCGTFSDIDTVGSLAFLTGMDFKFTSSLSFSIPSFAFDPSSVISSLSRTNSLLKTILARLVLVVGVNAKPCTRGVAIGNGATIISDLFETFLSPPAFAIGCF